MSFLIRLDDMQEALKFSNHPLADHFETILCTIGDTMAHLLAEQHDVDCGETTQEGSAFAGMCCPFQPRYRNQPLPEPFEGLDTETEWELMAQNEQLPLKEAVDA